MPVRWRLLGLIAGDPLLAAVGQLAQGVQRRMIAVADEPALAAAQRTFVGQRRIELAAQIGAQIDLAFQLSSSGLSRAPSVWPSGRQHSQRAAEKAEIARTRPAGGDPGQQPLDIVHPPQSLAEIVGQRLGDQFSNGLVPGANGRRVGQRIGHPIGQQPRPIAVTVRSSTASSEPSRRPSRIVRVISRLRRLD